MATTEFNDTSLELQNESIDSISCFKYQIIKLTKENECYKQEIHSLQSKIQVDLGTQNELYETIDNLEQSITQLKNEMDKKIKDIEEKNGVAREELLLRLNEVEQESGQKTQEIQELVQKLNLTNKLLSCANVDKQSENSNIHDESISQNSPQYDDLKEQLFQAENVRKCLEHTIDAMSKDESELKEILHNTKLQLAERDKVLEMTRDELTECRIELEAAKNVPANEMCKGNSLFAEVEDRRKKLLDRMAEMKKSYYNAKRCMNSKDNEIKALKVELAALLNKQKDDADDCVQENGDLLDKYKDRVLDLENKLSEQQKKYRKLEIQKQPPDNSFSYFQALLGTKNKEIEELEEKIENESKQSLIQKEMMNKTNRQMRYWRNKAMSLEAQIETIKNRLENSRSSVENKELLEIFQRDCAMKSPSIEEKFMDLSEGSPPIIDETVLTLDELIPIAKVPIRNIPHRNEDAPIASIENNSFGFSESNVNSNEQKKWQGNKIIVNEPLENERRGKDKEHGDGTSTNTNENNDDNHEKEKKNLRFAAGTVDPQPGKLRRQNTPKYPILYVSNKSNHE